jgi:hypothetical protein
MLKTLKRYLKFKFKIQNTSIHSMLYGIQKFVLGREDFAKIDAFKVETRGR